MVINATELSRRTANLIVLGPLLVACQETIKLKRRFGDKHLSPTS
jgi:hypothetical protein